MKPEQMHRCDKSEGKIFCVSIDLLGVSRCGYCGAKVPYGYWMAYEKKINLEMEGGNAG